MLFLRLELRITHNCSQCTSVDTSSQHFSCQTSTRTRRRQQTMPRLLCYLQMCRMARTLCFLYRSGMGGRFNLLWDQSVHTRCHDDDKTTVEEEEEGGVQCMNGSCMLWRFATLEMQRSLTCKQVEVQFSFLFREDCQVQVCLPIPYDTSPCQT